MACARTVARELRDCQREGEKKRERKRKRRGSGEGERDLARPSGILSASTVTK